MKRSAKVSVIMPSLNVGKYIRKCMDSVINQTLKDIEIICIDAGSTDGTLEILQEYAQIDDRIRIIHSEKKSYGYQMNLGIDAATGEYIGIVETDDFAKADMFENYYRTAKENHADVVKANRFFYWEKPIEKLQFVDNLSDLPQNVAVNPVEYQQVFKKPNNVWSQIYLLEFLKQFNIRFTETPGASFQDIAFNLKVWMCAQRAVFLHDAYLCYRRDNENSSVHSAAKVFYVCDEFKEVDRFFNKYPEKKLIFEKSINRCRFSLYIWNLQRVAYEYKYAFLMKMHSEIKTIMDTDQFDKSHFTDDEWNLLLNIIDDPEGYFTKIKNPVKQELENILQSKSFRIGRTITFIPRKLRDTIQKRSKENRKS